MPEVDPAWARGGRAARAPAGTQLTVVVTDEAGRPTAAPGLASWLRRVAPARAKGVVAVALVSDARVRALNRVYRHKNRVTDVLSFRAEDWPRRKGAVPLFRKRGTAPFPAALGDIVIARGVARRQARAARHSHLVELRVLALHGLLHLLGYDHERDDGRMLRLERRLRKKGGLREGLIERAK